MCASTTYALSAESQLLSSKQIKTGQTLTSIPSTLMIKIWTPKISLSSHLQTRQESLRRTSSLAMRKITMAATTSSIRRKQRRISLPASPRMALNTTRPNLTPTTSRLVSRMAPSIFMIQTASTYTGTGGMSITITGHTHTNGEMIILMSTATQTAATTATVQTRTIGATHILMSTATQIAATVPIPHQTHRSSIEASKPTPSFLLRTIGSPRLPSQHLHPLLRNKRAKENLLNPRTRLPQLLMSTPLTPITRGAGTEPITIPTPITLWQWTWRPLTSVSFTPTSRMLPMILLLRQQQCRLPTPTAESYSREPTTPRSSTMTRMRRLKPSNTIGMRSLRAGQMANATTIRVRCSTRPTRITWMSIASMAHSCITTDFQITTFQMASLP